MNMFHFNTMQWYLWAVYVWCALVNMHVEYFCTFVKYDSEVKACYMSVWDKKHDTFHLISKRA